MPSILMLCFPFYAPFFWTTSFSTGYTRSFVASTQAIFFLSCVCITQERMRNVKRWHAIMSKFHKIILFDAYSTHLGTSIFNWKSDSAICCYRSFWKYFLHLHSIKRNSDAAQKCVTAMDTFYTMSSFYDTYW